MENYGNLYLLYSQSDSTKSAKPENCVVHITTRSGREIGRTSIKSVKFAEQGWQLLLAPFYPQIDSKLPIVTVYSSDGEQILRSSKRASLTAGESVAFIIEVKAKVY